MENKELTGDDERPLAGFDERALAFSIDYALFLGGYWLSLLAFFPGTPPSVNLRQPLWFTLWGALFLVYQAYCSSEGRRSLGKSLLGLRVVDINGEPLSLTQGIIRSLAYLPSSVACLGFLWSLFGANGQCWHDLAVGSVVVREHPRAEGHRMLVRAGALACIGLFAMAWMWHNVWAGRYHRVMMMAYSQAGFTELARMQTAYHDQKGHYADNLFSLATVAVDPQGFLENVASLYDLDAGFEIKADQKGYVILAAAKDGRRTPMRYAGS